MTTMQQDVFTCYCSRMDELAQLFLRRMHQELAGAVVEGITGNQVMMMKIIRDHGRATVSSVADDLRVSLSAVTAQVDRLCRTGMVVRSRSERDRRVVWLELTDEGQKIVDTCMAARRRVMERYLGHLEKEELLNMIKINEKIITIMQQEEKEELKNNPSSPFIPTN